ncbi:SRPBCC family protein [Romeria aff. gracilis LEGE 07310]|uniref:SRPBCC family protein n=1 Tax=Vasconcelosia minhoensis LEGE 07310 TaxID=915328 RepID=A0A8J7DR71_9CYAN|nr:SRPBCC family protein [Romeria gracilis]MBE9077914.1 SRPBCC family protein [Romeria aff. gracilis LEGE 07310]
MFTTCFRWIWGTVWHPASPAPVSVKRTLERTYQVVSTASVETLWQTVTNLAEMASWHPLITATNAPNGLKAKPGLIYRVFTRWLPVPVKIFVERVLPGELLSVRIFPVPGLEERVIYRIESTVWGTQVSYSVTLRGWLSPFAWSLLKPYAAQVAAALAAAAEESTRPTLTGTRKLPYQDLLSLMMVMSGGLAVLQIRNS